MTTLREILTLEYEDAIIAEKMFRLDEYEPISEATAKILRFDYERAKNDPRPRVLVLGRWIHPRTKNKIVAGINLNYLNDEEIARVQEILPQVMAPESLKNRWWTGYGLLGKLWLKAYRQYDERFIHGIGSADIEPAPKDYEEPKEPGQPQDDEVLPKKAADEIQQLKKIEAQKTGEPPKEPQKKRGILRLAGDTIKKLAKLIKAKLFKNRQRENAKRQAADLKSKGVEQGTQADREVDELEKIEQEHGKAIDRGAEETARREAEQKEREIQAKKEAMRRKAEELGHEVNKLEDLEDYQTSESFDNNLATILEASSQTKNLVWNSPQNYIYWHNPERIAEHQERLQGSILDYCHGTKLIAVYNQIDKQFVIDLAESVEDVLVRADWPTHETVRIICDETGTHIEGQITEDLSNHEGWGLIQEFAGFQ